MKFNARIPVIPLPFKDRDQAVQKEILLDYGTGVEFPTIYVTGLDEFGNTKFYNITDSIITAIHGSSGDEFTININKPTEDDPNNIWTVKLGDILNILYTTGLTHDDTWDKDKAKEVIAKMLADDGEVSKSTTIVDNNGVIYMPRTLSKNVYTESGESIDVRLKSFSKVGLTTRKVEATEEEQRIFEIPFPEIIPNYLAEGNSFIIFVGGTLVTNDRYRITEDGNHIEFIDEDDYVEKGRNVVFYFIYNSATPDTGVLLVMDGKYITPGTIETNRLAEVSDSIDYNTPDAVASARAVCTLRNVLNERIDGLAGNLSVTCSTDATSTSTELVVKIPNYELKDSNMLHIRLGEDLGPNATLQVNNGPAIPIYNGDSRVTAGPKANEIINVSFNSLENRFYIYGVSSFKLETTYYHNSPEEGTSIIPFNLSYDTLVDKIDVFYNGVKMFPDINYTMRESSIELLDFVSEAGDLFTFELTQIVPVRK